MFDAQLRILLANIRDYVNSALHENEVLRKEVQRLQEENSKLKEDRKEDLK